MFNKSLFKVMLGVILLIVPVILLSGFNFSLRSFSKPLTAVQIDKNCPYSKDIFGRVYYSVAYLPSQLFVVGATNRKVQYDYHKIKGISAFGFKIAKILPEIKTTTNDPPQLSCIGAYKDSLVYRGFKFKNADPESFEILGQNYFKDKNAVYYADGLVIPEADPKSFEVILSEQCPYMKELQELVAAWDNERVYFYTRVHTMSRKDFEAKCVLSRQ